MAENDISLNDYGRSPAKNDAALTHARCLILRVCHLAGTAAFIDEAGDRKSTRLNSSHSS